MQVYVSKSGGQHGPFSVEQLRQLVQQGHFATTDHACCDGQNWITIGQVPGLAAEESVAVAPQASKAAPQAQASVPQAPVAASQAQVAATQADPKTKKKKVVLWASIGSAALLVIGVSIALLVGGDPSEERYSEDGISFFYPEEWEIEEGRSDDGAPMVKATDSSDEGGDSFMVQTYHKDDALPLREFMGNFGDGTELRASVSTVKKEGKQGELTGLRQSFDVTEDGVKTSLVREFYMVETGDRVAYLVFQSSQEDFAEVDSQFERIAGSFKLGESEDEGGKRGASSQELTSAEVDETKELPEVKEPTPPVVDPVEKEDPTDPEEETVTTPPVVDPVGSSSGKLYSKGVLSFRYPESWSIAREGETESLQFIVASAPESDGFGMTIVQVYDKDKKADLVDYVEVFTDEDQIQTGISATSRKGKDGVLIGIRQNLRIAYDGSLQPYVREYYRIDGSEKVAYLVFQSDPEAFFKMSAALDKILGSLELVDSSEVIPVLQASPPEEAMPFVIPELALEMLWCKEGEFEMGSPPSEEGRKTAETQHLVTLTQGFWMGKYEVTQAQWKAIMQSNPSGFTGDNLPVESVSWKDTEKFCSQLTKREHLAGRLPEGYAYQLPTEAQWEYACRAGSKGPFAFGRSLSSLRANFNGSLPYGTEFKGPNLKKTSPVGSYRPNAWGFHDFHGNVWEWCHDWYGDYPTNSVTDPKGPSFGSSRVRRGGSWSGDGQSLRSANQRGGGASVRYNSLGFRLCLRTE